jgi:tetratricopeptide (TPR) repeat protein
MESEGSTVYRFIRGFFIFLIPVALIGWAIYRAAKRSDDPPRLIFKWVLTFLIVGAAFYVSRGAISLTDVLVALVAALMLIIIWGANIGAILSKPFTMLYEDNTELEAKPYYSIAEAQRKRGNYTESISHIRKQLAKFPTDFQGQMMLAEIQAENFNDVQGAQVIIHHICEQEGHAPRNIAYAFNTLADWHLKYAQDRDAARQALEKIVELYPKLDLGLIASQRIAHLATPGNLLDAHDRKRLHVPEGIRNIGLLQSSAHLAPAGINPAEAAAKYVKHLEEHPFDTEAREKLAMIYADHYDRLDLAVDQLNQLIEFPNQPAKNVIRWLNQLTDLQIRHGADYETARLTLERIIERFPDQAAADLALKRIDLINLEIKAKGIRPAVKMGTYEKNIGLKYGPPKQ